MNQKSSSKISKGLVGALLDLICYGEVSCAVLKDAELCQRLVASGCIRRERVSRSRSRYVLLDETALRVCCRDYDLRLKDLEDEYGLLCGDGFNAAPSDYVNRYGKDHIGKRNLWNGFFIKSNQPVPAFYNGQAWILSDKCPLLVEDISSFALGTKDVTLWVVENYECFKDLSWMTRFPDGCDKAIVICRWPQSRTARESLPSFGVRHMYYFGDIDLAGINIFQTEFAPYMGADAFRVPDTYAEDLGHGSVEVFEKQKRYLNVVGLSMRIQEIIDAIKLERKGLLQEYYLVR